VLVGDLAPGQEAALSTTIVPPSIEGPTLSFPVSFLTGLNPRGFKDWRKDVPEGGQFAWLESNLDPRHRIDAQLKRRLASVPRSRDGLAVLIVGIADQPEELFHLSSEGDLQTTRALVVSEARIRVVAEEGATTRVAGIPAHVTFARGWNASRSELGKDAGTGPSELVFEWPLPLGDDKLTIDELAIRYKLSWSQGDTWTFELFDWNEGRYVPYGTPPKGGAPPTSATEHTATVQRQRIWSFVNRASRRVRGRFVPGEQAGSLSIGRPVADIVITR
jgi:hypothetical protein